MSDENPQGFTPEESAAMDAMKADAPLDVSEPSEPAPEAQPAPEAAEPAPVEDKPEKPPQGFVPHGAMHAEREKARAAEADNLQLRAEIAALKLANEHRQEQPQPETPPDPVLDPEKYSDWIMRQNAASQQEIQQIRQYMQQQAEAQQFQQMLQSDATAYSAEKQDYQAAEAHLIKARSAELQLMHPTAQLAQIMQAVEREKVELIRQAQQAGMRPAEFIYSLATHRGYAPPQPVIVPQAAQMQAQAAAQAATQSLASAPANAGAGDLTMESISKMSPAAYARLKAERPDDLRRVMQGA